MKGATFLLTLLLFFYSSCLKKDKVLPLLSSAGTMDSVVIGEQYQEVVYYDFEMKKIVATAKVDDWDLSFESNDSGTHVFINGGKTWNGANGVWAYNTHQTQFSAVKSASAINEANYLFDAPSGLPDSTAFGTWYTGSLENGNLQSKNEVYIIKLDPTSFIKCRIKNCTVNDYQIECAPLSADTVTAISFVKEKDKNCIYVNWSNNALRKVAMEPNKNAWDIVFTRFRHIYYDLNNFPYIVNAVLINPYQTLVAADSVTGYQQIKSYNYPGIQWVPNRNIIGFDWKSYDIQSGLYKVNPNKSYLIKTNSGYYYKLHFLDFYNKNGIKGTPTFEFDRL
jgi:hypothetical protein